MNRFRMLKTEKLIVKNEGNFVKFLIRLVKLFNIVVMSLPIYLLWTYEVAQMSQIQFFFWGNVAVTVFFALLYCAYARTYDVFLLGLTHINEIFYGQVLAAFFSDFFMYMLFVLFCKNFFWPGHLLEVFVVQIVIALGWSRIAHRLYATIHPAMSTLLIYDQRDDFKDMVRKYGMENRFDIKQQLAVKEALKDLVCLEGFQCVFLIGVHSHERNVVIKECVARNIYCYLLPRIGDVIMSGAHQVHLFHLPMLYVNRYDPHPEYFWIKRIFDIISGGVVLFILSPFLMVIAAVIKLQDGGSVFYTQDRLTKDGKIFKVYKFRSMRMDAEKDGVARLSSGENDDRITPVGRIIRKFRIDEFPQLLNIIKGDMSVVGPRPERPEIAAEYEKTIPEFRLRLQVKAGLTGYAQVYGKYNTLPYDKLQMDLMYIAKPSFFEDLRIIFATFRILFVSASTEGVDGRVM